MGAETKIAWTDHTFNPWIGCAKVSEGCKHCYAEALDKRWGRSNWGIDATRSVTSLANWRQPLTWNRAAEKAGVRRRVFCASLADVFEDREDLAVSRALLATVIANTPHLDWLLLTKRPEHAARLWQDAAESANHPAFEVAGTSWLPNVWLGTTAENQQRADERIPELVKVRAAAVRFVSYEPAIGPVVFRKEWMYGGYNAFRAEPVGILDWIIVGGESGNGARPFDLAWARSVVAQCKAADVSCFVKQLGAMPGEFEPTGNTRVHGGRRQMEMTATRISLKDPKGGDWDEWPEDLRVRQWPDGGVR